MAAMLLESAGLLLLVLSEEKSQVMRQPAISSPNLQHFDCGATAPVLASVPAGQASADVKGIWLHS